GTSGARTGDRMAPPERCPDPERSPRPWLTGSPRLPGDDHMVVRGMEGGQPL
ncbi:MAG: hypothetical protein AVDCRST_MAG33-17, partial [uncultured Thermomicrobiales bacterium]